MIRKPIVHTMMLGFTSTTRCGKLASTVTVGTPVTCRQCLRLMEDDYVKAVKRRK